MSTDDIVFKQCDSESDFDKSKALRVTVFCKEQGFTESLELDRHDTPFPKSTVLHIIALRASDETILGTVRMMKSDSDSDDVDVDTAKLGRLAIDKSARGRRLGKRLVTHAESEVAGTWGTKRVLLSSQYQVVDFYRSCGYTLVPDSEHLDDGWKHFWMSKEL